VNYNLNYFLIVFSLIFGVVFYDAINKYANFTYTDEIIVLFLFIYWLIDGKKNNENSWEFLYFSFVALFYLFISLYRPHNVNQAIIMDFLIQVKPFVAFYAVSGLNIRLSCRHKRRIRGLCVALAVILFPLGILYVVGNQILLTDLMGHPSRYATAYQILGLIYLFFSPQKKKNIWISILIVSISILSFRSKSFGFLALYTLFILFKDKLNVRNLTSLRNISVFIICFTLVMFFAWEKFDYYFIYGSEHGFARPMLYIKGFEILKDNPVFGTGFGSYGEYASSVYYSPIYTEYGLNYIHGLSSEERSFICDTYFPTLVQIGYVGICLFFSFWYFRIKSAQKKFLRDKDMKSFGLSVIIVLFFMIESIADSTLTHNRGIVLMMLLAMNLSNKRKISEIQQLKKMLR